MKRHICVPALIALSSTVTAPRDEIAFGIATGESVTKHYEATFRAAFTEVELIGINNGETMERTVPMNSSVERRLELTLTDLYENLGPDGALRLRRVVEEAHRVDEVAIPGQSPPTKERDSRLAETAVLVEWDEDGSAYRFSPLQREGDGDGELDERLFDTLRADADFRCLLPEGEVDAGDRWTVAAEHIRDLVVPGGDVFPFLPPDDKPRAPEGTTEAQLSAPFAGMTIPPFQWLAEPEGRIQVTYRGRDEDAAHLAVLAFEVEIQGALDPRERLDYHVASGMPAFIDYEYTHDFEFELTGQGVLRWDLERGILFDVRWDAKIEGFEEINLAAKFDNPKTGEPVDVEMNIQGDWTGSYSLNGRRSDR
jgi:hypothetical protein